MNRSLDLNALAQQDSANELAAELEQPTSGDATWTKEYAASGTTKTQPPGAGAIQ